MIGANLLAFRNASLLRVIGANLLPFHNASLLRVIGANLLVLNHPIVRAFALVGPLRHALCTNLLVLDPRGLRTLMLGSRKALHAAHAFRAAASLHVNRLTLRRTALDGLGALPTATGGVSRGNHLALLVIAPVASAGPGCSRR